ncbi:MAG: CDGSH iron-sulfur domain-containing protein [Pirellulales bacterium]|nr:CDGSH iron-sulfur domain-containing protein [Pirellulales bacterium]
MSQPVVIRCRENGPLVIEGPFQLIDHQGNIFTLPANKPVVALCRCGASANKPFCDGAHRNCSFVGNTLAPPPAPSTGVDVPS